MWSIAMAAMIMIVATLFSFVTDVNLAIILMGLYGFSLILQFITVNTLIQDEVPDQFRGRVLSLYTLTFFGIAPFGALALGFLAQTIGTPLATAIYALLGGGIGITIMLRAHKARQLA